MDSAHRRWQDAIQTPLFLSGGKRDTAHYANPLAYYFYKRNNGACPRDAYLLTIGWFLATDRAEHDRRYTKLCKSYPPDYCRTKCRTHQGGKSK